MRPYWLAIVPLLAAVVICVGHRVRVLVHGLGLVTALTCASLSLAIPGNEPVLFLGQTWILDQVAQMLLACLWLITALLLAAAACTRHAESFDAVALAGAGVLSAAILLDSLLLSSMLVPIAMLLLVLATPSSLSAQRGASLFLAWATLPIPLMLAAFALLERFALFPEEPALSALSALLVALSTILWLTLFPLHGTTRLWASPKASLWREDGLPLAPAFLWSVQNLAVVHLLLALWRRNPVLHTEMATSVLSLAGLATAVVSGAWACLQSTPGALLACAAMSELGAAVQGVVAGSERGLASGLFLLVSRSVAVLLVVSALAAMRGFSAGHNRSCARSASWRTAVVFAAFAIGILGFAGVPPLGGFFGRRQLWTTIQAQGAYSLVAWLSASVGIILGLVRTLWSLWHAKTQFGSVQASTLPVLLVVCLLLLSLWLGFFPQTVWRLVSDLSRHLPPLSPL